MAKLILGDGGEKSGHCWGFGWEGARESLVWATHVLSLDLAGGYMCVHEKSMEL